MDITDYIEMIFVYIIIVAKASTAIPLSYIMNQFATTYYNGGGAILPYGMKNGSMWICYNVDDIAGTFLPCRNENEIGFLKYYMDGLLQECRITSILAMAILFHCTTYGT